MTTRLSRLIPRLSGGPFVVFYGVLLVAYLRAHYVKASSFVYDPAEYWASAQNQIGGSIQHLFVGNFTETLRGVTFPLILRALTEIGQLLRFRSPDSALDIAAAGVFAWLAVFAIPSALAQIFARPVTTAFRAIFAAAFTLCFVGYIEMPLTDIWSLAGAYIAVLVVMRMHRTARLSGAWLVTLSLLAGFCIGAASNIRPAYQPCLIIILVLVVLATRRSIVRCVLAAALTIIGIGIAVAPQMVSNHVQHRPLNPWHTVSPAAQEDLFKFQLRSGLYAARFDTNLSDPIAPTPGVRVPSPEHDQGAELRRSLPLDFAYSEYLHLLADHPKFTAKLVVKRLLAAADIWHDTGLPGSFKPTWWTQLIGFASLVLSGWALLYRKRIAAFFDEPASLPRTFRWLAAILLVFPALIALPGAIETRLMMPVWIFVFAGAATALEARPWHTRTERWVGACVSLVIIACFFVASHHMFGQITRFEWPDPSLYPK